MVDRQVISIYFTYTCIYVSWVFMGKEEESKYGDGWGGGGAGRKDVGVWIDDEDVHRGEG